jgi:hypothetical protein
MSKHLSPESAPKSRRRRFAPLMVAAGLVGAALLGLSMTGTLSAFTAAITNTGNTAAAGSIVLKEVGTAGTTGTCYSNDSTSSCSTINKYGGSTTMIPSNAGGTINTVGTTITFQNTGNLPASSFVLTAPSCTQTGTGTPTDMCSKMNVKIVINGTTAYTGTAAGLVTQTVTGGSPVPIPVTAPTPNSGTTTTVAFTVWVDSSVTNAYQGLGITQPLVWTATV